MGCALACNAHSLTKHVIKDGCLLGGQCDKAQSDGHNRIDLRAMWVHELEANSSFDSHLWNAVAEASSKMFGNDVDRNVSRRCQQSS